ncbi:hypothetical protein PRIPAC_92036 [Pristionchus pacificus]|uniref:Uncharacterized protein n=1 Tax=Pristionchus pacificus TaxID=54126 RepID=A0A2A6B4C0_PRIPA|nr:hypothetical protein PRIPAC_92036 [Pristionchus pacificus]|eukprot:PDM60703.1 hypothetical protein PRIPAC_53972 [Pristionchus pacificus]
MKRSFLFPKETSSTSHSLFHIQRRKMAESTRSRQRTVSFSSGVSNMDILYRTQQKWRQLARESGRKREDVS